MSDSSIIDQFRKFGITRNENDQTNRVVHYICNHAYSTDSIKLDRNTKFPGSLVVSVSRSMLKSLNGIQPVHKKYSKASIVAWISQDAVIPSGIQLGKNTKTLTSLGANTTERKSDVYDLEFGDEAGFCTVLSKNIINVLDLDFGDAQNIIRFE